MMDLKELIIELFEVGGLKFGDFTVRTGEHTPVYIDMRIIWSHPKIVIGVCQHMWKLIEEKQLKFKSLVGLPYQGIPIATYLSTQHMVPMLMKRQSQKQYGTMKSMEGHFEKGDKVLIIDDVLMTGTTLLESADVRTSQGI